MPEMKAIFLAAGPDIRRGVALEPFENVNVYPLIAKILGLDITNLEDWSDRRQAQRASGNSTNEVDKC